jgi:hypothetical protein
VDSEIMQSEIISAEEPLCLGRFILTPVAKLSLNRWNIKDSDSYYITKQAVFIIVTDAGKSRAFNMAGEEVSATDLKVRYPQLSFIKEAD